MTEIGCPDLAELNFQVVPWHRREHLKLSEFDKALRLQWQKAMDKGMFLHRVESEPHRIPGARGYVGMLCRNRASHKRKSQSFMKLSQERDPKSFNFTKVKEDEILMKIEMSDSDHGQETSNKEEKLFCHVIINNSPYEYAHSLLVPEMGKLLIQSINLNSIKFGIEMLLRSRHPGFRVMYNSLCAGASVNHLHLHCYYTEYWLPSEVYRMIPLMIEQQSQTSNPGSSSDCFEIEQMDSSVRGFGFIITKDNYDITLPNKIHKIINYFNQNNLAHNIVIIRGAVPNRQYIDEKMGYISMTQENGAETNAYQNDLDANNPNIPTIENDSPPYEVGDELFVESDLKSYPLVGRVYIFPRKMMLGGKSYTEFLVNVTELFDHLHFGDVDVFNSMNENDITKGKEDVSLSEKEFVVLKSDLIKILTVE